MISQVAGIYAYGLLKHHFHLPVRIKPADKLHGQNPVLRFSDWFNAYAKAYNTLYGRHGSLFQRPFRRIPVTTDSYLVTLVRYLHRNPQRHGFVSDFREWEYSSYHRPASAKPTFLKRDDVPAWFDSRQGFEAIHAQPAEDAKFQEWIGEDLD